MELVLIRHGQTVSNQAGKHQGWQPVALTPLGIEQAEKVHMLLKQQHFDRIWVSDLHRTKQTAEIIFGDRLEKLEYSAALREINTDVIAGVTYQEMTEKYGDVYLKGRKGFDYSFCGGESAADFSARVQQFLDQLKDSCSGQRIAVVTHGGVIHAMLSYMLGIGLEQAADSFVTSNCGVSYISCQSAHWKIVSWNQQVKEQ